MIVETLTTRGIGDPFKTRELALDFRDIPGGSLIAFVGENGEGKTHAIEFLCTAPLFREHASYRSPTGKRGDLVSKHVPEDVRDAYLQTRYDLDGVGPVLVELKIDGKTGKIEPYLTARGVTVGPGQADVDAEIAKLFASRDMMLIGPFACQGGHHGFFRLSPAERKQVFAEMIGAGLLAGKARAAAKRATALADELGRVRDQIITVEAKRGRVVAIGEALVVLAAALVEDATRVEAVTAPHATAHQALAAAREALRTSATEAERVGAERTRLTTLRGALAARIAAGTAKLVTLGQTLADREAIEAKAATLPELERKLADAQATERVQVDAVLAAETALATAAAERTQLATEYRERAAAVEAVTTAEARLADVVSLEREAAEWTAIITENAAALMKADAGRPALEAAAAAATAALAEHDAATPGLDAAAATERQHAGTRTTLEARRRDLEPQTALLDQIPGVDACGACPLTENARTVKPRLDAIAAELAALPAPTDAIARLDAHTAARAALASADLAADRALQEHDAQRRVTADRKDAAQTSLATAQATLAARAEDRQVIATAATLRAALEDVTARGLAAKTKVDAATAARDDATGALGRTRTHLGVVEIERKAAAEAQAKLPALAAAAEALAATTADVAAAEAEDDAAFLAVEGLPTIEVETLEAAVATATTAEAEAAAALAAAREALATHQQERATLDGERKALGDPEAELVALEATAQQLATDAADWSVLERGLLGVQAALIAAAGPEVSAIANDLLASAGFGRFQIALTTTQPLASGRGVKEVFDARIFDADAGRDGTRGSGGQQALIDTALRLGTVIVNTHRSGKPCRTLWFDEATAALSKKYAPRLPEMLRRAAVLGSFHHIFLISHDPNVWEQADVRFVFENGVVERDDRQPAPPAATSVAA